MGKHHSHLITALMLASPVSACTYPDMLNTSNRIAVPPHLAPVIYEYLSLVLHVVLQMNLSETKYQGGLCMTDSCWT